MDVLMLIVIIAVLIFIVSKLYSSNGQWPLFSSKNQTQEVLEIFKRVFSGKVDEVKLSTCISSIDLSGQFPWYINLLSMFEVGMANVTVNAHYNQLKKDYEIGITIDGYGIADESGWNRTLQKVVDNIAIPTFIQAVKDAASELTEVSKYEKDKFLTETIYSENVTNLLQSNLKDRIDYLFREKYENEPKKEFIEILNRNFSNGIEYEHAIAKAINLYSDGWNAEATKASGDQGLDILARHPSGITVAIQAKLYSSPVGNKAVQEVISAMGFYKTNFAAVVTNNKYTESAKQLAASHSIELLHHNSILDYIDGVLRK